VYAGQIQKEGEMMPCIPSSVVALALATLVGLSPCSAVAQSEILQPKKSIKEIISHFRAEMDALIEKLAVRQELLSY
jgi:hypothetical protein